MSNTLHSKLVSTLLYRVQDQVSALGSYRVQSDAGHPPSSPLNHHPILRLLSMHRNSNPTPILAEAISPVLETVSTDKAPSLDFEVTATFKLSNIRQYFEDDPAATARPVDLFTSFFGPQLRLCISSNTKSIGAYLDLNELNPVLRPMFIWFSLKISADAEGSNNIYFQRTGSMVFLNNLRNGSSKVLTAEIWEAEEPLRRANAVYLLAKVVGSLS